MQAGRNIGTTTGGPTNAPPTTLTVIKRSNWIVDDETVSAISWSEWQQNWSSQRPGWQMYFLVGCNFSADPITISYRLVSQPTSSLNGTNWTRWKSIKLTDTASQEPGLAGCFEVYVAPSDLTNPPLRQGFVEFKAEGPICIDGCGEPAAVSIQVIGNPPPTPTPSPSSVPIFQTHPMLSASPGTVLPTDTVLVTGDSFPPPTPDQHFVILTLNPQGNYVSHTASASGIDLGGFSYQYIDSNGHFSRSVGLPSGDPSETKPGTYTLTAELGIGGQVGGQLTVVAQTPLTISAPRPRARWPSRRCRSWAATVRSRISPSRRPSRSADLTGKPGRSRSTSMRPAARRSPHGRRT